MRYTVALEEMPPREGNEPSVIFHDPNAWG
jgi:hypothetical protein